MARDAVCGWLSDEVQAGVRAGVIDSDGGFALVRELAGFRGRMGQHS